MSSPKSAPAPSPAAAAAASAAAAANNANSGKKAVHVKWAGKTIALGTFPSLEADEKCQKAKVLTRNWRSSMRPKPSRDWVMLELERLGVRVVSGRLGRKAGEDGDDDSTSEGHLKKRPTQSIILPNAGMPMERTSSIGWGASDADLSSLMMARRNSSLGLSIMNDVGRGSLALGQVMLDSGDPTMPPHRPLVGGGAAAAYEAARHDHFTQKASEQQRRASSLGLGSLGGNAGIGNVGLSVSANQHYEMLKLHHMNLLNEIQETTLMMNLYQQQQLQQQQQQLQAQANAEMGNDSSLAMMMQGGAGGGLDMFAGQLSQRGSLALGSSMSGGFGNAQLQLMQQQAQQQAAQQQALLQQTAAASVEASVPAAGTSANDLEGRIAQLKQDIAKSDDEKKRPAENTAEGTQSKRAKKADEEPVEKAKGRKSEAESDDDDDDEDDDDDDDEED